MSFKDDEFGVFFRMIPVVLLPLFVAAFWFKPSPPPPLPNTLAFGCYSTGDGPKVRLDADGMQVLQSGFPRISYHLERSKQGIVLSVDAPIDVEQTASGHRFMLAGTGAGRYLPFYRLVNGQWYAVFQAADIERFRMASRNGSSVVFEPVPTGHCIHP